MTGTITLLISDPSWALSSKTSTNNRSNWKAAPDTSTDSWNCPCSPVPPPTLKCPARPTALSCFGMNTHRSCPNRHGLGQKPPDHKCLLKHMIMPDGLLALIPIGAPVE